MAADAASGAGGARRILVVDDDVVVREVFCDALARDGFIALPAEDGRTALAFLARDHIDAVLLDSHMPDLDGLEVLAEIRARPGSRTLPVILVTGRSEVEERVRGLDAGANDYLTKPVAVEELVARVRAQLRGQAAWLRHFDERLRERTSVGEALCRIRPQASPETTSRLICGEISRLRHVAGVGVLTFSYEGSASVLSWTGLPVPGFDENRPLPLPRAVHLREQASRGAWVDRPGDDEPLALRGRPDVPALRPVAFAPLTTGGDALGVLAVVPAGLREHGVDLVAQALSSAIDYATIAAALLAPALQQRAKVLTARAGLEELLMAGSFTPVFQPIVDLADGHAVGYEVLTRFGDGTPADVRFAQAAKAGLGADLEAATMAAALASGAGLPDDAWMSVNVSPHFVESDELRRLVSEAQRPLVLELTEHDPIEDYAAVREALRRLGDHVRISVDDAGAGYASLHHILALRPDFVKLDRGWVAGIDDDPARQALVSSLQAFAARTECRLIAEGIETEQEAAMLRLLDVELGQGFLLGRPAPLLASS